MCGSRMRLTLDKIFMHERQFDAVHAIQIVVGIEHSISTLIKRVDRCQQFHVVRAVKLDEQLVRERLGADAIVEERVEHRPLAALNVHLENVDGASDVTELSFDCVERVALVAGPANVKLAILVIQAPLVKHDTERFQMRRHGAERDALGRIEGVFLALMLAHERHQRLFKINLAIDANAIIQTRRLLFDVMQIAHKLCTVTEHVADACHVLARVQRLREIPNMWRFRDGHVPHTVVHLAQTIDFAQTDGAIVFVFVLFHLIQSCAMARSTGFTKRH